MQTKEQKRIRENKWMVKYFRTKRGLITKIYNQQRSSSRIRNQIPPEYTLDELREWMLSNSKYHILFDIWVKSDYQKMLIPSCDRKDDYKHYTLDNLRIVTWRENEQSGYDDRRNGINTKSATPVVQMTINGEFVAEYYSIKQAGRETGIHYCNISSVCTGKLKTAGGFLWKHA